MRKGILWTVTAAAALPWIVGCSHHPNIVRGQSPAEGPGQPTVVGTYDPTCPPGYGPACPPGHCPWADCYDFKYREPRDLVYPPPNAAPPVVQYPYYTCKGPDCFFHQ
jgi:hypothetical protein